MNLRLFNNVPLWSLAVPVAACVMLAVSMGGSPGWVLLTCAAAALIASVLVAVHHAEVIAHRVGEPFGTLVLALAVTVIEVSLIVSMMRSAGTGASSLARDTVFATVMIICNGVVGLCLLVGSLRHHVLVFRVEGTTPPLAVLTTLTTLTLVLPTFTTSTPGPTFSSTQLVFAVWFRWCSTRFSSLCKPGVTATFSCPKASSRRMRTQCRLRCLSRG